jgi:hypothetical protein
MRVTNVLELTQTTDFLSFVGYFSPCRAKNNLQKKKSTMLPFVLSLSKGRLQPLLRKSYVCEALTRPQGVCAGIKRDQQKGGRRVSSG